MNNMKMLLLVCSVALLTWLSTTSSVSALELRLFSTDDYYTQKDANGKNQIVHKVWDVEDLKQDLTPSGTIAQKDEIKPINNQLRCIYNSYKDIVNQTPTYSPELAQVVKLLNVSLSAQQICKGHVTAFSNLFSVTYGDGDFYKPNDVTKASVIGLVGVSAHGSVYVNTKPRFQDVKLEQSYWDEIEYLANRGIVNGTSSTAYSPNAYLKKTQVASMLSRALKLDARYPANYAFTHTFSDVPKDHYAYLDIMRATEAGIFDKTATFNGLKHMTRGEMAIALTRGFTIEGAKVQPKSFTDITVASVGQELYDAVQTLSAYSIAQGTNGKFNPNDRLTRQHFAVFLARTMVPGAGFRYIYISQ